MGGASTNVEVGNRTQPLEFHLSRDGATIGLQLRASNEGLLRPRVARARETNGAPLFSIFDRPFDLATGFTGFYGIAAIVELFALGESELHLGMTAL